MFRKQAVENQQVKLYGNVIIPSPFAAKWVTSILLVFITFLTLLLIFGEFSRRVSVTGYLKPSAGLLRIKPPTSGFVEQIQAHEGQSIEKGYVLFNVTNQTELRSGQKLNETLRQQLLQKKQLIQRRIEDQSSIYQLDIQEKDEQARNLQSEIKLLTNQHNLLKQQLSLAHIQFERTNELFKSNMTTKAKLEQEQINSLQIAQQISELELRISTASDSLGIIKLSKQKNQLRHVDTLNQIRTNIVSIDQQLIELSGNDVQIITAPTTGTITKINIKNNDLVQANQVVMHLLPEDTMLKVELLIPPEAIGFIKKGQEVKLRLSAFPYQKFGLQNGHIESIAQTASTVNEMPDNAYSFQGSVYIVTAILDRQYVTAFGQQFQLKPGMTLQADIKLAPRALWEWLLEPLLSLKGRFA